MFPATLTRGSDFSSRFWRVGRGRRWGRQDSHCVAKFPQQQWAQDVKFETALRSLVPSPVKSCDAKTQPTCKPELWDTRAAWITPFKRETKRKEKKKILRWLLHKTLSLCGALHAAVVAQLLAAYVTTPPPDTNIRLGRNSSAASDCHWLTFLRAEPEPISKGVPDGEMAASKWHIIKSKKTKKQKKQNTPPWRITGCSLRLHSPPSKNHIRTPTSLLPPCESRRAVRRDVTQDGSKKIEGRNGGVRAGLGGCRPKEQGNLFISGS